jgi:hypothetical protein
MVADKKTRKIPTTHVFPSTRAESQTADVHKMRLGTQAFTVSDRNFRQKKAAAAAFAEPGSSRTTKFTDSVSDIAMIHHIPS